MKIVRKTSTILSVVCVGIVIFSSSPNSAAYAQTIISEAEHSIIAEEVRKELTRLIEDTGILDSAIEKGIEAYIKKQRLAATAGQDRQRSQKAKNMQPVSLERDHIYGDPNATISMVEYSDYECPFCKRFHLTAKKLINETPKMVNWVYRHFPLEFHNPGAQKEAEATECAAELGGNEAFWRYSDLIYERTNSNGNGFPIHKLTPLAEEIGLDGDAFAECVDSGTMAVRVREDYEDGVKAGISGTPGAIFVNNVSGKMISTAGAQPLSKLQAIVDRLLSSPSSATSE